MLVASSGTDVKAFRSSRVMALSPYDPNFNKLSAWRTLVMWATLAKPRERKKTRFCSRRHREKVSGISLDSDLFSQPEKPWSTLALA
jgi:hypothetical protein